MQGNNGNRRTEPAFLMAEEHSKTDVNAVPCRNHRQPPKIGSRDETIQFISFLTKQRNSKSYATIFGVQQLERISASSYTLRLRGKW